MSCSRNSRYTYLIIAALHRTLGDEGWDLVENLKNVPISKP
jgi:hypothetical protein